MTHAVFNDAAMTLIRRAYARQILGLAGVECNQPLEDAFATIAREQFLGPPPWELGTGPAHRPMSRADDPVVLYQDVVVSLDAARGVNNGSPSLHAAWIDALAPRQGERIAHIGAGGGYYTAILSRLVGPRGQVLAVEIDARLAQSATENLHDLGNVTVVQGDGLHYPEEPFDGIYVNFGVERPRAAWVDNLEPSGRLIFPLGYRRKRRWDTPRNGRSISGGGFKITRVGDRFSAKFLVPAFFVAAEGPSAETDDFQERLRAAFKKGGQELVRSFLWNSPAPANRCWFGDRNWAFSYDPIEPPAPLADEAS